MDKTTKIIIGAIVIILVIVGIWYSANKKPAEKGVIKIGAIYTTSGIGADIGKALQEGTEVALEEINSQGGINGRKLEIIYEDDPDLNPQNAVSAAQKLIVIDKVSVVLDMPYTGLASIQNIAEKNQVPVVDVIDSSDQIASFGDWIFSTGIYADGVGAEVAKFAKDKLAILKAAILMGKDEYLMAVAGGFEKTFISLGGEIVNKEEYIVGDSDFRTQLSKIKSSGAEAIFVSHLGEGGLVVKQAVQLGFKGKFLGADNFSLAEVKNAAGSLLNNITFFSIWRNFDALTAQQQNFSQRYKARFGKEAGDQLYFNVLGYDGLMVVADAFKKSDLSDAGIKNALYQIKDYPGLGASITIDSSGINRDSQSIMVMYKEGNIVRY